MKKDKYIILYSLGLILITFNLWLIAKIAPTGALISPFQGISQFFALIGTVLLSFELVLTSRLKFLEKIFGPLDRIYQYHKYLSIFSLIGLITHVEFLVIHSITNQITANIYLFPTLSNLPYAAGIIAFYLFSLTIIITLYIKLPYKIWKFTHRVLAMATLLATYHVLTISSDISNSIVLKLWIVGGLFIGVASMLYKVFVYKKIAPKFVYEVSGVQVSNDIIKILMKPIGKRITYRGGNFAYFTFFSKAVSREEHPFSIVSSPNSEELVIGVKKLGDYTSKLQNISIGDTVEVRGPYGEFGIPVNKVENVQKPHREVWIGAGIGITPILSLQPRPNTILYYINKDKEPLFQNELLRMEQNGVLVINYSSDYMGRFNIQSLLDQNIIDQDTIVRICAPIGFLQDIENIYARNSLPLENLIFEDFNLFN